MHHVYEIPGVVDMAVVQAQADRRRRDKHFPEDTTIHRHRHEEPCNERCTIITVADLSKEEE